MNGLKYFLFFCLVSLTIIVSIQYSENAGVKASEKEVQGLPKIGSFENLKKILKETENSGIHNYGAFMRGAMSASEGLASQASADLANKGTGSDYSQTNVQVEGVDEADTVKTDGEYIYKISGNKIIVAQANPPEEMKVVSAINYDSQNFSPAEMYVDKDYLIVIGNNYHYYNYYGPTSKDENQGKIVLPRPYFEDSVKVLVYDLSDKKKIEQIREVEVDGSYVSSRKIDNNIYLVNNKYIDVYRIMEQNEELPLPAYRDSADGGEIKKIGYEDIAYFPGSPEPNYLIMAGINLDNMTDKKIEVKTYLGSGQSVYSSLENLYVAVAEYKQNIPRPLPANSVEPSVEPSSRMMPTMLPVPIEVNTSIYKFSLQNGAAIYEGKGSVAGRILNQFSMDEHKGNFRIATTVDDFNGNEIKMSNNLFILDKGMTVTGKIENIAPDERIYSVRFLGDRGYMVTFKTVDPLFVLDLKDPRDPKILGELKIPGYSNYLHPYDENHIIGFGKEAIEVEEPHWSGQGTVKNAYYLGMKIALFDVSDVKNPKEKFNIEIGDRGTDSELLWNHKALLFSKEKNLMAFPVTVHEVDYNNEDQIEFLPNKDPRLAYGNAVFQGALVYNLSSEGFELQGTITHHPLGKIAELQRNQRYDYDRDISRILYIDDTLYTVSNGYLKANGLATLEEKGGISF